MRITEVHVTEIKRLAGEHWSQSKIANYFGVCRDTIRRVLSGQHKVREHSGGELVTRSTATVSPPNSEARSRTMARQIIRCGGCGEWILPPCEGCERAEFRRRMDSEQQRQGKA